MFSSGIVVVLRLFHIGAGVFWVGGVLMFARFIFPAVQAVGPAAGPFMDQLTRVRQLPRALLGAGFVTSLSGLLLYWHDSAGFQGAFMSSVTGMTLGTGGLLAIVALVIGLTVNSPTARRLGALAAAVQTQGAPPSPEQSAQMQQLQARLGSAGRIVMVLLVLATAAMATARYL
ncbi:MAG TPA: hypothetical protein VJ817_06985 [Gemmatimonadales bacterium]|nr:hypothetical protein [Gemmatimonadales bacterium]